MLLTTTRIEVAQLTLNLTDSCFKSINECSMQLNWIPEIIKKNKMSTFTVNLLSFEAVNSNNVFIDTHELIKRYLQVNSTETSLPRLKSH